MNIVTSSARVINSVFLIEKGVKPEDIFTKSFNTKTNTRSIIK